MFPLPLSEFSVTKNQIKKKKKKNLVGFSDSISFTRNTEVLPMDLRRAVCVVFVSFVVVVTVWSPSLVSAGDIVHDDEWTPKKLGCVNRFVLVKVPIWIDGREETEFVGVSARFGPTLESKEKHAHQTILTLTDSPDCCSTLKTKLTGHEAVLVYRGNCSSVNNENVAEAAGASAILIVNKRTKLFKMLYSPKRSLVDVAEVFLWLMASVPSYVHLIGLRENF